MLDVCQGKLVSKELERKASTLKKVLLSAKCCEHTERRGRKRIVTVSRTVSSTQAQRVLVRLISHAEPRMEGEALHSFRLFNFNYYLVKSRSFVHLVARGILLMMSYYVSVNTVVLGGLKLTGMHKTGCSGDTRLVLHVPSSS